MTKQRRSIVVLLVSAICTLSCRADEGMWLFSKFPKKLIAERYSFAPSEAWLEHLRLSSVRFNNGGSGAFVSPQGLVMTNHHVGSECIQELGSAGHDYMADGFYARVRDQELKCPNLELNILMGIEDVTAQVNGAAKPDLNDAARNAALKGAMSRLEKECTERTKLRCDVVTLYQGGVYDLYRYKKYTDVRLVFAPEADIAFYGGDPDNFVYPRYDLDVAFFHVYENGSPVRAEHYLTWNPTGVSENSLVFVSGNPGTTRRQQTLAQLEFLRDVQLPLALKALRARLTRLREYSSQGPEQTRVARDLIFGYENSVKVYVGFQAGLADAEFMARRSAQEKQLRERVAADPKLQKEYGRAWDEIAAAQKNYASFYAEYNPYRSSLPQSKLYLFARDLVRLPVELAKPNEQQLRDYSDAALESVKQNLFSEEPVYAAVEEILLAQAFEEMSEIRGRDDPLIQQILAGRTPAEAARAFVSGSKLSSATERKRLFEGGQQAVDSSRDSMIALARQVDSRSRELRKRVEDEVQAVERTSGTLLSKALFAARGTELYPEATFTLRLSFGAVRGYMEEGRPRRWYTSFHGLYETAAGVPPYKLPERWIQKKSALNLDTPFNFVSTPDITGGNSGSPVTNREGQLVGIVFDGNLQQIPNDFLYSDAQARTIAVHAAGILEALGKVYGAEAVLRELKIARGN